MNRRARAIAALVAMVAMLFAPLAMALHACPSTVDMVAAAQALADPSPAGDAAPMDMAQCERHCSLEARAAFDLASAPAVCAAPVIAALRVPALAPLPVASPAFDSPFALAAGPAPPRLRSTVLRI